MGAENTPPRLPDTRAETNTMITQRNHPHFRFELENPKFDDVTAKHDWRNNVPYFLKELWPSLSLESKTLVCEMADRRSNAARS